MSNLKDITGQEFGMLTVIERCEPPPESKRSGSQWLCRCECGKLVRRRGSDLRQPRRFHSCGCRRKSRPKLEPGMELGVLVIVEEVEAGRKRDKKWLCRCKLCGEAKAMWANVLHKNPNRKDCGCLKNRRFKGGNHSVERFYEPGRCPNITTCGPCQRAGRSGCFYTAAQLAAFREACG